MASGLCSKRAASDSDRPRRTERVRRVRPDYFNAMEFITYRGNKVHVVYCVYFLGNFLYILYNMHGMQYHIVNKYNILAGTQLIQLYKFVCTIHTQNINRNLPCKPPFSCHLRQYLGRGSDAILLYIIRQPLLLLHTGQVGLGVGS